MQEYNVDMDKIIICDIIDIYNGRFTNYEEYRESHMFYIDDRKNEIKYHVNLNKPLIINPELFEFIKTLNYISK